MCDYLYQIPVTQNQRWSYFHKISQIDRNERIISYFKIAANSGSLAPCQLVLSQASNHPLPKVRCVRDVQKLRLSQEKCQESVKRCHCLCRRSNRNKGCSRPRNSVIRQRRRQPSFTRPRPRLLKQFVTHIKKSLEKVIVLASPCMYCDVLLRPAEEGGAGLYLPLTASLMMPHLL